MSTFRGIVVALVSAALVVAVVAYRPVSTSGAVSSSGSQVLVALSSTPTLRQPGEVVWGRVPYCSCLVDSATDSVSNALKEADLTVSLQELSPRDDWLYFAVTFDPSIATPEQVHFAMVAGGAEVLEGPP